MAIRKFIPLLLAATFAVSSGLHASSSISEPTLDEIAGEWTPMTDVENPPAVHNFNQMLVVDRDLTTFFYYPGGIYPWKKGIPDVRLNVDGQEYPAREARAYAYRALRRNPYCNGLAIESDTRMVNEQRGVLCQITAVNSTMVRRASQLSLTVYGALQPDGVGVMNTTLRGGVTSVIRPSSRPDGVKADGGNVVWQWNVNLPPGGTARIGFVAGDGASDEAKEIAARVANWASNFDKTFDDFKQVWEQRWADAFTPGNKHFSGSLPVLIASDKALMRNYYVGIETMLILERTQFPVSSRSFITSGERTDGTQFYWDASMQATVWALLEPHGMKATLRCWLVQNPRSGAVIDIRKNHGFDAIRHDRITGYAFNASTIFKTAEEYIRVTGDRAFLDERLENGKTVLEQMDALATDWETLPPGPAGTGLVDYGENGNLLECAPAYIHCVPSLHAQDVWMMRRVADLHAMHGDKARAAELRAKAARLLPSVQALYKPGDGVWYAYHMDGTKTELRHCVDYIYVGNGIQNDLSITQKNEMNAFVKRELFMRDWMRAMSQKDAAAARSDRPDHGPMGAYDGWIPLTVGTMWRLGDARDAYDFYCRTATVTSEGPFAQAREFYGPLRDAYTAPVRVAMRLGCMKECISGVAFADVVVNTFFGFSPSLDGKGIIADPGTPRPFNGVLKNVHVGGHLVNLVGDARGIRTVLADPLLSALRGNRKDCVSPE